MRRTVLVALLAVVVFASFGGSALAAAPKTQLSDVESALMCDTCNVGLAVADSDRATEERQEIKDYIKQGLTKKQILDRFYKEYGNNVLAEPRGGGASVTVWAIPAAVLVVVVVVLLLLLPRWRRKRAAGTLGDPGQPSLPDEDAERLERDLALYE